VVARARHSTRWCRPRMAPPRITATAQNQTALATHRAMHRALTLVVARARNPTRWCRPRATAQQQTALATDRALHQALASVVARARNSTRWCRPRATAQQKTALATHRALHRALTFVVARARSTCATRCSSTTQLPKLVTTAHAPPPAWPRARRGAAARAMRPFSLATANGKVAVRIRLQTAKPSHRQGAPVRGAEARAR
jgi:hypothetical protein